MKKIKTLLIAALALFTATTAMAQEETRSYPYGFIGLQGGGQAIMNGYSFGDVITGTGSVYGGVMFTPVLGTRLHLNGWNSKEGVKIDGTEYGTYGFSYGTATIDMLVNLVSAINHRDDNAVDLYLIGGLGINKVWGNEYKDLGVYPTQQLASKVHNHVAHACRLGLAADFNLAPAWALNLEVDANHFGNHDYAHLVNASKDWQLTAQLGVKYRFGQCKPAPAPVPVPEPVQPKEEPKPVEVTPAPAPAPAPVVVEEVKPCIENVFFLINRYDIRPSEMVKVNNAIAYLNKYPSAKIEITGYADKNTGNATINERLSKQRVNAVYDVLISRGIAASRIIKDYKGDTVQPFPNDEANYEKNRCVICVAE